MKYYQLGKKFKSLTIPNIGKDLEQEFSLLVPSVKWNNHYGNHCGII